MRFTTIFALAAFVTTVVTAAVPPGNPNLPDPLAISSYVPSVCRDNCTTLNTVYSSCAYPNTTCLNVCDPTSLEEFTTCYLCLTAIEFMNATEVNLVGVAVDACDRYCGQTDSVPADSFATYTVSLPAGASGTAGGAKGSTAPSTSGAASSGAAGTGPGAGSGTPSASASSGSGSHSKSGGIRAASAGGAFGVLVLLASFATL
ncbi:uncharacterized protein LOC62_03G003995 [Vanrija pseudolonga]|uniref:Extracellular membrane protein CFEM domain-containing protein n=1 Tax=Vanrija pseudolonga TaxID=143232 RepID=A0AAF1BQ67_9TREE|nr:hypothetical protein LOC62_03G003995 [Vanrija pseudolonga]